MTTMPSIRQRLLNALLQVTLACALAVTASVWFTAMHEVDEHLDAAIQESAEILFGLLSFEADNLPMGGGGALPAPQHDERLVWQLVDAGNQVVLRSHRAPLEPLMPRRSEGFTDAPGGWRVYGMDFPARTLMLYVAQTGAERREVRIESGLTMIAGALAIGGLCALWLRRRVRRELEPLQHLSRAVAAFDPLEPGATLADAPRAELQPIRDAVVDLGERLALRVDTERAFTAHAAHALRTPLAGMTAQLAVAMREAPDSLQPRLQRARAASERLSRVVSALLTLFRAGVEPTPAPIEFGTLVASLPAQKVHLVTAGAGVEFVADVDLLAAALMNIIDNAERHGASELELRCHVHDGRVVMHLVDDGPGVSREQLDRLADALATQSYEQGLGLGLGLMLADMVARAHRGHMRLLEVPRGFGVEITLPYSAPPPHH